MVFLFENVFFKEQSVYQTTSTLKEEVLYAKLADGQYVRVHLPASIQDIIKEKAISYGVTPQEVVDSACADVFRGPGLEYIIERYLREL